MTDDDRIQELERRLALLEARMASSPEWSPEPGNKAEEGLLEPLRLGDGEVRSGVQVPLPHN